MLLGILTALLKRAGPYGAALALGVAVGAWVAHRLDAGSVAQARAAELQQQVLNAQAVAEADAKAAAALAAATRRANAAEGALAAVRATSSAAVRDAEARVRREAAIKGADGPVAPVLSDALRALRGAQ